MNDENTGKTGTTQVDLGDDLLDQSTASIKAPVSGEASFHDLEDQMQSARIMVNEGMLEEAKHVLRRLLLADPRNVMVQQMLHQIHDLELKQIFGDEPQRKKPVFGKKKESSEHQFDRIDSTEILRELDRDLDLNVLDGQLSLFEEQKAIEEFAQKLDRDLSAGQVGLQDRMDIGIAFMEMGLHDLASRVFKTAVTLSSDKESLLSFTGLLAYSLILAGRPYDATLNIQPVLRDTEIKREEKLELFYLMGRAHEYMKQPHFAVQWYQHVRDIDPRYRDIEDRLRDRL